MKRGTAAWDPLCHWCNQPARRGYVTENPQLPTSPIRVCGPGCPKRPDDAPVATWTGRAR